MELLRQCTQNDPRFLLALRVSDYGRCGVYCGVAQTCGFRGGLELTFLGNPACILRDLWISGLRGSGLCFQTDEGLEGEENTDEGGRLLG